MCYSDSFTLHVLVKINKRKAHLKWSQEASRGSFHDPALCQLQTPTGREVPCTSGGKSTLLLKQEEHRLSPCSATAQPVTDCPNLANEKPLYFELTVYTKRRFVYDKGSQLCPFFSKGAFLLFVLLTCLWFYCSLRVLNCNSLLFPQINPFCWQTN